MAGSLTCEDVLDGVGNDEVLVGDETVDGLVVALGHGRLSFSATIEFGNWATQKQD